MSWKAPLPSPQSPAPGRCMVASQPSWKGSRSASSLSFLPASTKAGPVKPPLSPAIAALSTSGPPIRMRRYDQ